MIFDKTAEDGNVLGNDTIEILLFNYNGKGDAIVRYDGGNELECLGGADLDYVLFGEPLDGKRGYAWRRPADVK